MRRCKRTARYRPTPTNTFNALFTATNAKNPTVTASYSTTNGSQLVLTGSATVNTSFMSIIGVNSINITASSTSTWGNTRLRVALVLDNTGSMASSNKMTALKTASQNLLTQLQSAAVTADDVYVSIVPFNKDVNVDTSNVASPWLRWDLWEAVNGKCSNTTYKTQIDLRSGTAKSGRPIATAPGTAASPTATRISTPPTTPRWQAVRCTRPSSIPPARCR